MSVLKSRGNRAVVMHMLAGKTALLADLDTRPDLRRRLACRVLDSDDLAGHQQLVMRHGEPSGNWDERRWARWNTARQRSIELALRHHRGALVLVHTCAWADLLSLEVAAVVWVPTRLFTGRLDRAPDRAALARANRLIVQAEIETRWPDPTTRTGLVFPFGRDALCALASTSTPTD